MTDSNPSQQNLLSSVRELRLLPSTTNQLQPSNHASTKLSLLALATLSCSNTNAGLLPRVWDLAGCKIPNSNIRDLKTRQRQQSYMNMTPCIV